MSSKISLKEKIENMLTYRILKKIFEKDKIQFSFKNQIHICCWKKVKSHYSIEIKCDNKELQIGQVSKH